MAIIVVVHGYEVLVTGVIVALWYWLSAARVFRRRGLDPALVTYVSPLAYRDFWVGRIILFISLIFSLLIPPLGTICGLLLLMFCGVHILLLLLFERAATQPLVYYLVSLVVAVILLVAPIPVYLLIPVLVTMQELAYHRWKLLKGQRYNQWVAQKALNIHKKYLSVAKGMSPQEWFYILHVAVTEDVARPRIVRLGERLYYYVKRPAVISTGIMQIRSKQPLSDHESFLAGSRQIRTILHAMPAEIINQKELLKWVATHFNGSSTYTAYLLHTLKGAEDAWRIIEPTLATA